MCLDKLGKFKPATVGYKVMNRKGDGRFSSPLFGLGILQPVGEWSNEVNYREDSRDSTLQSDTRNFSYPIGWHIFHTLKAAQEWDDFKWLTSIVKVEIRKPIAVGYQEGRRITVAKEIKIMKELQ